MSPTRSARNSNTGLIGLYTQSVDVTDVQVFAPVDASKFPPDKAATWSIPTEHDNLVLMHNAIRAEVTKFEALLFKLGARQLKRWEKDLIKTWWEGHMEHVLHHIGAVDNVLRPWIHSRVIIPTEYELSHTQLLHLIETVDKFVRNRNYFTTAEVAPVFHGYRTALYPHFAEQENVMIPLIRAYFRPEDMREKTMEILRSMPKLSLGSILNHIAGGKDGIMTFMARVGYAWHAWYTEVHAIRTSYRVEMESKLESLLRREIVVFQHKKEFVETKALRPLKLNPRLVRTPSNASELASRITSEIITGRLPAERLVDDNGAALAETHKAVKPVYMRHDVGIIA